jgi:hypothetical protein
MTTTSAPAVPDQAVLLDWGARFLNALLDSADPDVLGRSYWDRARSAFETGCSAASYSEAVSKTTAKLEIHGALSADSTEAVAGLAAYLSAPAVFGAWSRECSRDAVYVTALARIARDERREAAKTRREEEQS